MAKLEMSDLARSIKGRIREVEEQLKDHKALSDELERLKRALARLEGVAAGAKYIRWVPLIQSLEFAAAHPEEPADRPGPEWLTELFQYLTKK